MKKHSMDDKRTRILDTASELFAKHPYHKVLLSDVARIAAVGKGTLYLYFKSKDDLYYGVLFRGFSVLVEKLQQYAMLEDLPADEQMAGVIRIITERLYNKKINMEMLGGTMACPATSEWNDKRLELWGLVEAVIRRGVEQGVFEDANPRLTAQYVPSILRSVCLFTQEHTDINVIYDHACAFVLRALSKK